MVGKQGIKEEVGRKIYGSKRVQNIARPEGVHRKARKRDIPSYRAHISCDMADASLNFQPPKAVPCGLHRGRAEGNSGGKWH